MRLASGVVDQYVYFVGTNVTDHLSRLTGYAAKMTVVRSRNGAADAAYTTPTISEIDATTMPGVYALLMDEDTTLDAGDATQEVALHIKDTGGHMDPVTRVIELFRPEVTAGETLTVSGGIGSADIKKIVADTGAANQVQQAFATAPSYFPQVDVRRLMGDTGAGNQLQQTFNTVPSYFPGVDVKKVFADTGAVAHIQQSFDVTGKFASALKGLDTGAANHVNQQVVDALNVDTYAEPGTGAPPATTTIVNKLGYVYKAWRNKTTQDTGSYDLYNDDAVTIGQLAHVTDDGATFTRGEVGSG